MRYDKLLAIYPDISDLFRGVAELIHESGVAPEMAAVWAQQWIVRHISKEHRKPAGQKAYQFIRAICGEEERVQQCNIPLKSTRVPTMS
jgi:hypothetical protein